VKGRGEEMERKREGEGRDGGGAGMYGCMHECIGVNVIIITRIE
jgi:hypothetical protein